jgi:hypothetical protein
MSRFLSNRAQVEISRRVVGILRAPHIGQWQSEPHQQHQNLCKRRYQTLKTMTTTLFDCSSSPVYTWLLCLMYVAVLLNLTYNWTIGGIPLQCAEGSTQDISPFFDFIGGSLYTLRLTTRYFHQFPVKNADTLWAYLPMLAMP